MEKQPLISVITVCFNCREMVGKTLASVAEQDFDDFEFVVVDGGSTDGTLDKVKEYGGRVDVMVSERDRGIFDAMNKGVRLSSGRWIVFMNAGDTFAGSDTLSRVAKAVATADADIVYGDQYLDRGGEYKLKEALEPANRHRMYFCHQSAYVKREVLERFPCPLDIRLAGDYLFFKQAFLVGYRFKHVAEPWVIYDCTGVSSCNRMKVLRENIRIVNQHDSLLDRLRFLPRLYFVTYYGWLRGRR